MRNTTNNAGTLSGTLAYDAWGTVTSSSGGVDEYRYAGTTTDAVTGLIGDDARG